MKVLLIALAFCVACQVQSTTQRVSPIEKVLSMLSDLQAKIVREGTAAQKAYDEFAEWCEDRSKNVGFEIKDGKSEVAEQSATIESSSSEITSLHSKIEEIADALSHDEADLTAATKIRETEEADFKATEKDLVETIDILERAILVLEKEMKKGGAAMVQMQKQGNLVQALSTLVEASLLNSADASKLTALVQSNTSEDDDDAGAPAAAVYSNHGAGIIDTLENLLEKAKGSLAKARGTERSNANNFAMLKQSLSDEIKVGNKDLANTKKSLASTQEQKATAQGDLSVASKGLNEDTTTLKTLHQDCLEKSQDFEAGTKSRAEELKALATARSVIAEATSGADSQTYALADVSFLQTSSVNAAETDSVLHSTADLANFEAVRLVRDLARKTHDQALAQLASRMAVAIRRAKAGADPFAKVRELIKNMIETLLSDSQADASHKAYCDKELGQSAENKAEKTATVEKLSTQIDSMSAKSAQLKEQSAKLQKELAEMARSQSEMMQIRTEERNTFRASKAEMEEGITGVKTALKVLRDYYAQDDKAHASADGASEGIVSMLEVVESDFTKGLSEMTVAEQTAQHEYDTETQSNKISKATKDSSVKYKTKEFKGLDQSVSEAKSDRSTTQEELDSIMQYLGKLDDICIAKAEPFSERKRRREEEIAGLKEALNILNGEAVLLQRTGVLRGTQRH